MNKSEKKIGFALKALIIHENRALIMKRNIKDDYKPRDYDLPGGRLAFGETPEDALIREASEETGLEIKIIMPLKTWTFKKNENEQIIGITYLAESDKNIISLSHEHENYEWMSLEQIKSLDIPVWLKEELELGFYLHERMVDNNR